MADFEIEMRPVVVDVRRNEAVLLRATRQVGDRHFWRVAKADQVVCRLLAGKSSSSERLLSRTDIIDRLVKLRNDAVLRLDPEPAAMVDLGLDDPATQPARKRTRAADRTWPDYVTITAPTIGPASSIDIRVLPALGSSPLWVELTPDIVGYLATTVSEQIEQGAIKNRRPQDTIIEGKGLNFDRGRRAVRARRADGKQRYFREQDYADATESASAWLSGVDSPPPPIDDAQGEGIVQNLAPIAGRVDEAAVVEEGTASQRSFLEELWGEGRSSASS